MKRVTCLLLLGCLVGCATPERITITSTPPVEQTQKDLREELEQSLRLGMPKASVPSSFDPLRCAVIASTDAEGVREQWVYTFFDAGRTCLYFDNGKLTSWEVIQ